MKVFRFGRLDARVLGGTDGQGAGDGPVIVLLHGFGAPGDDLVPLARVLRAPEGTRFVFPAAPNDLGPRFGGGRAWWNIDLEERMRRQAQGEVHDVAGVPPGLDGARAAVDALLDGAERALAPAAGKLVLGGFSQGAMLSLDVTLRSQRPLAGLVLLSGTHIAADEWAPGFAGRRGLPVFMSHGEGDEVLPFGVSKNLRETLQSNGLETTWVAFRGGHGIPPVVIAGVNGFLARVLDQ